MSLRHTTGGSLVCLCQCGWVCVCVCVHFFIPFVHSASKFIGIECEGKSLCVLCMS